MIEHDEMRRIKWAQFKLHNAIRIIRSRNRMRTPITEAAIDPSSSFISGDRRYCSKTAAPTIQFLQAKNRKQNVKDGTCIMESAQWSKISCARRNPYSAMQSQLPNDQKDTRWRSAMFKCQKGHKAQGQPKRPTHKSHAQRQHTETLQSRHFSQGTPVKARHSSRGTPVKALQSKHSSRGTSVEILQSRHSSRGTLTLQSRYSSRGTPVKALQSRYSSRGTLVEALQSRHSSRGTPVEALQSWHSSQGKAKP